MNRTELKKINVDLVFNSELVLKIKADWPSNYGNNIKIFLQRAYQGGQLIGWHGDFADEELVESLDDGFMFENKSITFYGITSTISEAITELNGKKLSYPQKGRIFIKLQDLNTNLTKENDRSGLDPRLMEYSANLTKDRLNMLQKEWMEYCCSNYNVEVHLLAGLDNRGIPFPEISFTFPNRLLYVNVSPAQAMLNYYDEDQADYFRKNFNSDNEFLDVLKAKVQEIVQSDESLKQVALK
jgi:hypothetical protein